MIMTLRLQIRLGSKIAFFEIRRPSDFPGSVLLRRMSSLGYVVSLSLTFILLHTVCGSTRVISSPSVSCAWCSSGVLTCGASIAVLHFCTVGDAALSS